ncbi:hypothetical protein WG66_014431 [Moniliophthora roreri]|nr:hypothetical protein WG66_014431 [Moniliophthora roreri]
MSVIIGLLNQYSVIRRELDTILEDGLRQVQDVWATRFVGFAGFTILLWDHIDTFTMEVNYIWLADKGPLVYLFLINRYLTPLGFIVNLNAYISPHISAERCRRFIRYEGAMTMIGIDIAGLMMLIRNHKSIVAAVASILAAHIGINGWLLTKGIPQSAKAHKLIGSCLAQEYYTFNHGMRVLAASTAWLPLVYDTAVFCLTFYKTYPKLRLMSTSRVMKQLLRDGIVYYGVILAVTLVLTLMIAYAPPGLQNVAAHYYDVANHPQLEEM